MKIAMLLLLSVTAWADMGDSQGILPGEPDPNGRPGVHYIYKDNQIVGMEAPERILLEDTKCPKGQKAYFDMKCGPASEVNPKCEKFTPVIKCGKKVPTLNCKKPKRPVPVVTCDQAS